MFDLWKIWVKSGKTTEAPIALKALLPDQFEIDPTRFKQLDRHTKRSLSRSLLIRHLDTGSCNAEEAELVALSNPIYDLSRYGIGFTPSPRHADILAITGPVTRQLKIAMQRTYDATPDPKLVIAIGDGACYGTPYEETYGCLGRVDQFLPVDIYIPGDPPTPQEILEGLLTCKWVLGEK